MTTAETRGELFIQMVESSLPNETVLELMTGPTEAVLEVITGGPFNGERREDLGERLNKFKSDVSSILGKYLEQTAPPPTATVVGIFDRRVKK